jgi:hypothetical protein
MRVSKVRFLTLLLKYVTLELSVCRGNDMSGLEEQRKLYDKLQKTIRVTLLASSKELRKMTY